MPQSKRTASGALGGLAGIVGLSVVAGILITATVTPAIAVSGAAAKGAITVFDNLPSSLEIEQLMLPTTAYAKNPDSGEYQVLTQWYDQNRSPVKYEEITPVMYDAILSSEDPRYYEHGGIDLIGTTRAVMSNFKGGGETQGGSSISQQYVKNILVQKCESDAETDEAKINCWNEATTASGAAGIERKLQEMRYAIALEQKYSKNDILLGYLNIANFGGQTYGIDAAAKHYFGVPASQLSIAQAATLAGIVQNPNTYRIDMPGGSVSNSEQSWNKAPDGSIDDANPGQLAALDTLVSDGTITQDQYLAAADGYTSTKGRQLYVLSRMLDEGKITRDEYVAAAIEPITPNITTPPTGCAAATGAEYFCQYVRYVVANDTAFGATEDDRLKALRRGGLNIYTTLDWNLQSTAQQTMSNVTPTSVDSGAGRFGASAVSIEAGSGRILSVAQNTVFDETTVNDPNRSAIVYAGDSTFGASTGFNAGSTFKLFTLIDWLEKGHSVNEVLNGRVRAIKKMTNSCQGDWTNPTGVIVNNYNKQAGYVGTPMQFTRDSLNSGYFAMGEKLDLCDISNVIAKMGVTEADGDAITMQRQFDIIGSWAVSPLAMAGAYATVANNGIYCQPQAIDRVTDAQGNDIPIPQRSCSQVIEPNVAAAAAYALQGVMKSGGTGSQGNPFNGVPLIGKTGTHETIQTWLVESSTKVATATWVGNSTGSIDLSRTSAKGMRLNQMRYTIAKAIQGRANELYGGDAFATPDNTLTRQVLTDLPNVVGQTIDQATKTLEDAGFAVTVGQPVDSAEGTDIVAAQDPGAGQVASGTTVTISPSNGQGVSIPNVSGTRLDQAMSQLRQAGFGNVQNGSCTVQAGAPARGSATATTPAAGTVTNRNTAVYVDYVAENCGGGTGQGNSGPGNSGTTPGNG